MNIKRLMKTITIFAYIVFFIICERIMDCAGSGLMGISLMIYSLFFLIFIGSIKDTLSKMVSIRRHRGFVDNAKRIFGYCICYCVLMSIIVFAVSFFLSGRFCDKLIGDRSVEAPLIILGVFFALEAFCATIRGYYIGCNGSVFLTASEGLKCVSLIVAAPLMIKYMGQIGEKAANLHKNPFLIDVYGSMGAAIALCISDVLMLALLLIGLKSALKNDSFSFNEVRSRDGFKSFARSYLPQALSWIEKNIFPTITIFLLVIFFFKYCKKQNFTPDVMYSSAGMLFAPAFAVFFFALTFFKNYIEANKKKIRVDYKKDDHKSLTSDFNMLLKNAMVVAFPISFTVIGLSSKIPGCIFGCENEAAGKLVLQIGIMLLFACFDYLFAEVLGCMGRDMLAFAGRGIGFVCSLIMALSLSSKEFKLGFVITALLIGYGVSAVMCGAFVFRSLTLRVNDIVARLIKVGIASVVLILFDFIFSKVIPTNALVLIITFLLGYVIYLLLLMALKTFSSKDISGMSGSLLYYPISLLAGLFRIR